MAVPDALVGLATAGAVSDRDGSAIFRGPASGAVGNGRGSLRSSVRVPAIALEALAGTLPSPDQLQREVHMAERERLSLKADPSFKPRLTRRRI